MPCNGRQSLYSLEHKLTKRAGRLFELSKPCQLIIIRKGPLPSPDLLDHHHVTIALFKHASTASKFAQQQNNAESSEAPKSRETLLGPTLSALRAETHPRVPLSYPHRVHHHRECPLGNSGCAPAQFHNIEADDERDYLFTVAMTLSNHPMITSVLSVPPS